MFLSNHRHSLWITCWGLVWILLLLSQPTAAQSTQPQMQVGDHITITGRIEVTFTGLPSTIDKIRWSWNQEPTDEVSWRWIEVEDGNATKWVNPPPDYNNYDPEAPPILYVQLLDLDGTIISLNAPFIRARPIEVTMELLPPERAMSGYTNQNHVNVRLVNIFGGKQGYVAIPHPDELVIHDFFFNDQPALQPEYPLPALEGEILIYVAVWGEETANSKSDWFSLIRDITPPTLTHTQADVDTAGTPARLVMSGRFTDKYAPLPHAIEWQFVASDGSTIGSPVFHVLSETEVGAITTAVLSTEGTPYQLQVTLDTIPVEARMLQVRLFDRAGNSQAIEPIQLPNTSHTVHIPFVGR
ncbi:MAG TPA: hypothetical protein DEF43_08240 [Chloroflexus aurantiacus]|jgi:hypothetical protein|uniref:Uncharacterized protein n=1 Tax=Chloroflexus aurantiacus (strain ATCC 29366 / DSM 635 / J-10-fl) TaxID=324602 RepID=A9WH50_CHLAA|nr:MULTISPECIES: hypothetical protein [Chloroflexus]ABY34145.1 hypothetical protein Caur_0913 [Chloroflexus aurantiacus J-10-fl]RMG51505.1 MAG: hypothetical protein D6716_05845 [Chloroflexota bacterium]GIV93586.1 MAG: hypothetical protein KatS3mg056_2295 [Chloroflexus sp.]HBW67136.1 hypothetical protein [Chloroflexus aurantiacus]